jgi:hypothetical protein
MSVRRACGRPLKKALVPVDEELEHAGFPSDNLSDDQVADLGRRITESPIRHCAGDGQ